MNNYITHLYLNCIDLGCAIPSLREGLPVLNKHCEGDRWFKYVHKVCSSMFKFVNFFKEAPARGIERQPVADVAPLKAKQVA